MDSVLCINGAQLNYALNLSPTPSRSDDAKHVTLKTKPNCTQIKSSFAKFLFANQRFNIIFYHFYHLCRHILSRRLILFDVNCDLSVTWHRLMEFRIINEEILSNFIRIPQYVWVLPKLDCCRDTRQFKCNNISPHHTNDFGWIGWEMAALRDCFSFHYWRPCSACLHLHQTTMTKRWYSCRRLLLVGWIIWTKSWLDFCVPKCPQKVHHHATLASGVLYISCRHFAKKDARLMFCSGECFILPRPSGEKMLLETVEVFLTLKRMVPTYVAL